MAQTNSRTALDSALFLLPVPILRPNPVAYELRILFVATLNNIVLYIYYRDNYAKSRNKCSPFVVTCKILRRILGECRVFASCKDIVIIIFLFKLDPAF